jgi:hypothetical protein
MQSEGERENELPQPKTASGSPSAKPSDALNEPVLADDYPIYGDYLYVADGRVIRSDWHGITAAELKRREKIAELRRCDIVGRRKAGWS